MISTRNLRHWIRYEHEAEKTRRQSLLFSTSAVVESVFKNIETLRQMIKEQMKWGDSMVPSPWSLREKILLGLLILFVILFGSVYVFGDRDSVQKENQGSFSPYHPEKKAPQSKPKQPSYLMVDVKGAVKKPGIYRLPAQSRVYQAIQSAGGFLQQADRKQVNLAQKCKDEMVIYIPVQGETVENIIPTVTSEEKKINLNTATVEELEQLSHIGPKKAEAIVEYRDTHGPFRSIDQLANVPGIGEKTIDRFRDQVTVE